MRTHHFFVALSILFLTACGGSATPDKDVTDPTQAPKECDCGEADLDSPPPPAPGQDTPTQTTNP